MVFTLKLCTESVDIENSGCHVGQDKAGYVNIIHIIIIYGDDKEVLNIEGIRKNMALL